MKHPIHFFTTLLLLALLAACVPGEQGSTPEGAVADTTSVPEAEITDTATGDSCDDGFRQVNHELLDEPICVPQNPQRIVAHDMAALELMLMLDIAPVARPDDDFLTATYGAAPVIYERVLEIMGNAPVYGSFEMNVEVLVEAQPDLVLSYADLPIADQVREFTTLVESPAGFRPSSWSQVTEFYAEVLGVTAEYEQLIADYQARMETYKELRDPALDGASAVYVQDAGGANYVGLPGLALWETLNDAGFVPVDTLPTTEEAALEEFNALVIPLSEEQVPLLDADVIIFANGNVTRKSREAADELIESYRNDPLWQTLDAVQNDRFIPTSVYWQSNGLISSNAVVDDLFLYFTDADPAAVSPNPFLIDAAANDQ
ncbi:MAG: ABC transporter substrate-binding protein [Chloroflexales bacterium]|nr:ABC transporter substrate-binding protein [Chloroflexales bacterium]